MILVIGNSQSKRIYHSIVIDSVLMKCHIIPSNHPDIYLSHDFQIFRALGTTFDGTKLSALFSRLLDTIGDNNEDVQVGEGFEGVSLRSWIEISVLCRRTVPHIGEWHKKSQSSRYVYECSG